MLTPYLLGPYSSMDPCEPQASPIWITTEGGREGERGGGGRGRWGGGAYWECKYRHGRPGPGRPRSAGPRPAFEFEWVTMTITQIGTGNIQVGVPPSPRLNQSRSRAGQTVSAWQARYGRGRLGLGLRLIVPCCSRSLLKSPGLSLRLKHLGSVPPRRTRTAAAVTQASRGGDSVPSSAAPANLRYNNEVRTWRKVNIYPYLRQIHVRPFTDSILTIDHDSSAAIKTVPVPTTSLEKEGSCIFLLSICASRELLGNKAWRRGA